MNRGEVYRVSDRIPERGNKPGYYVIVSRSFVSQHEGIETVVCAPVYGEILGITTEVVVGAEAGLPRISSVRCDFLALLLKTRLTRKVGALSSIQIAGLNRALAVALDLDS